MTSAVLNSVNAGWNVIDTAANYRWGRAEAAIGEAIQALRSGLGISTIQRSMLFVSTKAGFIDAELLAAAGKDAGSPDVADGSHCVHPACLQASLQRSLRQLKLSTVRFLRAPATASCASCWLCASLSTGGSNFWAQLLAPTDQCGCLFLSVFTAYI